MPKDVLSFCIQELHGLLRWTRMPDERTMFSTGHDARFMFLDGHKSYGGVQMAK